MWWRVLVQGLLFIYLLNTIGVIELLTGCRSEATPGMASVPECPANATPPVTIGLPSPAQLTRMTSAAAGQIDGADFDAVSIVPQNVSALGTEALFTPGWDPAGEPTPFGLAYALYWIQQPGYEGVQRLGFLWSVEPGAGMLWVAVADWVANCWVWNYVEPGDDCILAEDTHYVDLDGRTAFVVLLIGTNAADLIRISFLQTPSAVMASNPDPASGAAPLSVVFDGSASSSPNGGIEHFLWDFDGSTPYELDTGTLGTASHNYATACKCRCRMSVVDNWGAQASACIDILATGTAITVVDDGGVLDHDVGAYTSLCVVNGYPAISYYDNTSQDLLYVRAMDAFGGAWGTPQILDSTGNVGMFNSLCMVNNHPSIAYGDGPGTGLKYIQAKDPDGAEWWGPITVDGTIGAGVDNSLCIVDGQPAIGFWHNYQQTLCFVRSTDHDGTGWYATQAIGGAGTGGSYCSLAVINDCPAIAYFDTAAQTLGFVRAIDAAGTSWAAKQVLDDLAPTGGQTALCQLAGGPGIAYHKPGTGLRFVHATDASGNAWALPVDVDGLTSAGQYCSAGLVQGVPVVSHIDISGQQLRLARATSVLGETWATSILVDDDGVTGWSTSLAAVMNCAGISYRGDGDLRFALVVE